MFLGCILLLFFKRITHPGDPSNRIFKILSLANDLYAYKQHTNVAHQILESYALQVVSLSL